MAATVAAVPALAAFGAASAQTCYPDVPMLAVGEDENPLTVGRSHEIFRRVIAELKGVMSRAGLRVVDEATASRRPIP